MCAAKTKLPPLPTISDILRTLRIRARKRLSQNFLMEHAMMNKIVRTAGVTDGMYVCEVGPGPGGITRAILKKNVKQLDVIELDRRFVPGLNLLSEACDGRMVIHEGDILKFDFEGIWPESLAKHWNDDLPNARVVGNLPFKVATALIIKWLHAMSERRNIFTYGRVPLTLTFQKEVAERIVAPLNNRQRCRLSVMCQSFAKVDYKFTINGETFVPPPLVDAAVVNFVPLEEPIIPLNFKVVEKLCRHLFHYRQKPSLESLKTLYPMDISEELAHEVMRRCRLNPNLTCTKFGNEEIRDMCYVYDEQCRRIKGLYLYEYFTKKNRGLDVLEHLENAFPPKYIFEDEFKQTEFTLA